MSKAATVSRHVLIRVRGDVRETRTFFTEAAKDEVRISDRSEDHMPTVRTTLEGGRAIFAYLLAEGWQKTAAAPAQAPAAQPAPKAAAPAKGKPKAKGRASVPVGPNGPVLIEDEVFF